MPLAHFPVEEMLRPRRDERRNPFQLCIVPCKPMRDDAFHAMLLWCTSSSHRKYQLLCLSLSSYVIMDVAIPISQPPPLSHSPSISLYGLFISALDDTHQLPHHLLMPSGCHNRAYAIKYVLCNSVHGLELVQKAASLSAHEESQSATRTAHCAGRGTRSSRYRAPAPFTGVVPPSLSLITSSSCPSLRHPVRRWPPQLIRMQQWQFCFS